MKNKIFGALLLVTLVAWVLYSCNKNSPLDSEPTIEVEAITLAPNPLSVIVGETSPIIITITPSDATYTDITWKSDNMAVATVDQSGNVTAISEGSANVSATIGEISGTCVVNVMSDSIPVDSITLTPNSLSLTVGETAMISAAVAPTNATYTNILWSSDNPNIATVDQSGNVAAIAEGNATISASIGDIVGKSEVAVASNIIPVESITLSPNPLALTVGGTGRLIIAITPANATYTTVTWNSSNPAAATVDQEGNVTAIAEGDAVITATIGDITGRCNVNVASLVIPVESITLSPNPLDITIGQNETLSVVITPSNATYSGIVWSSGNPSIATVDQSGKVTAVDAGTAIITATIDNVVGRCSVEVSDIQVQSISISPTTASIEIDETQQFTATIYPSNATNVTYTWTSGNNSVATVTQNGLATGISAETTTITVTTNNGKSATATLTVTAPSTLTYTVDQTKCTGCGKCLSACQYGAISIYGGKAHIDPTKCTGCGNCVNRCPRHAIVPNGKKHSK